MIESRLLIEEARAAVEVQEARPEVDHRCDHRLPAHGDGAHLCATCREIVRMLRAGEVPF